MLGSRSQQFLTKYEDDEIMLLIIVNMQCLGSRSQQFLSKYEDEEIMLLIEHAMLANVSYTHIAPPIK